MRIDGTRTIMDLEILRTGVALTMPIGIAVHASLKRQGSTVPPDLTMRMSGGCERITRARRTRRYTSRMVSGTATPSPTPSATARSVSSSSNKPKRGGGLGYPVLGIPRLEVGARAARTNPSRRRPLPRLPHCSRRRRLLQTRRCSRPQTLCTFRSATRRFDGSPALRSRWHPAMGPVSQQ